MTTLALTVLLILFSFTAASSWSVHGQVSNGSYMQSFWTTYTNPEKEIVHFHISQADLAPSGTQRFLTITDLLQVADAASNIAQLTITSLLSAANDMISVALTPNGNGDFDFTIVQISGNWVAAYFGICNKPLDPSCQLAPFPWPYFYLGSFSSLPTPGYWPLYFSQQPPQAPPSSPSCGGGPGIVAISPILSRDGIEQSQSTAQLCVYSMSTGLLGQDPHRFASYDLHATIEVDYVYGGQAKSITLSTPFGITADPGSYVTLTVISNPPSPWIFACEWDYYLISQSNTCDLSTQISTPGTSIAAYFSRSSQSSPSPPSPPACSLYVSLTVTPLSGQAPFTPNWRDHYYCNQGPVTSIISWGDGTTNDITNCGYNCPSHTYYTPGTYTITVTVTDSSGNTASDSQTITVGGVSP